jgi:hypothetical protein
VLECLAEEDIMGFTAANKANSGISIAFPDVCWTPAPPVGPVPIPYPITATTAVESQQTKLKIAGGVAISKASRFGQTIGDQPGTLKGMVAHEQMQLQSSLNQANARLQTLKTRDPNEWQKALTEYAVLASALYRTLYPDD